MIGYTARNLDSVISWAERKMEKIGFYPSTILSNDQFYPRIFTMTFYSYQMNSKITKNAFRINDSTCWTTIL